MSVLGLVPARAGSKGVPQKNFRPLAGVSPVVRACRCAREAGCDAVLVTSDATVREQLEWGCQATVYLHRPPELAQDDTPMLAVVEHALQACPEYDLIVLLQPTAPLRTPEHIRKAVKMLRDSEADSVVSVVPLPLTHSPDCVMRLDRGELRPFLWGPPVTRRQDARQVYLRDGTVYAFWRKTVTEQHSLYGRHCLPMILDPSESLSLDTMADWDEAERRLSPSRI